eukprot:CAMPEP_0198573550 /NCGR_PEP_ID=MMETSP1462-20131121/113382_1 /TAXON_ID=1333877 /ORGANISM="Brandtodinium nutriculum, Strain RCC3387" /LENGTH=139 /DNA_ID=CAMNT_0044304739 /DNA_START=357 /DNA_END=773 /DNA_ORIENTATION=+
MRPVTISLAPSNGYIGKKTLNVKSVTFNQKPWEAKCQNSFDEFDKSPMKKRYGSLHVTVILPLKDSQRASHTLNSTPGFTKMSGHTSQNTSHATKAHAGACTKCVDGPAATIRRSFFKILSLSKLPVGRVLKQTPPKIH